jgi:ABC-type sugar transport system substrate-binding protein
MIAALLAACGSSGNTKDGAGVSATTQGATQASASTAACIARANAFLAPYESLPTTLPSQFTPLPRTPVSGGTIIRVSDGQIETDVQSGQQMAAVASSFGWTGKFIVENGTIADLNAKIIEAVSEKPQVIVTDGNEPGEIATSLAAAKSAGIVVVLGAVVAAPTGYPGFSAVENGSSVYSLVGDVEANLFMASSKCAGDVHVVNIPYPILRVGTTEFENVVKSECSACKVSYQEIPTSDLASQVGTSAVVAAVESDPKTNYIYATISNVADGLSSALSQAGIKNVAIFGQTPDPDSIAALQSGSKGWWIDQSSAIDPWETAYVGLRALETHQTVNLTVNPFGILTSQNVPKGISTPPVYPSNYAQLFKQLW